MLRQQFKIKNATKSSSGAKINLSPIYLDNGNFLLKNITNESHLNVETDVQFTVKKHPELANSFLVDARPHSDGQPRRVALNYKGECLLDGTFSVQARPKMIVDEDDNTIVSYQERADGNLWLFGPNGAALESFHQDNLVYIRNDSEFLEDRAHELVPYKELEELELVDHKAGFSLMSDWTNVKDGETDVDEIEQENESVFWYDGGAGDEEVHVRLQTKQGKRVLFREHGLVGARDGGDYVALHPRQDRREFPLKMVEVPSLRIRE